MEITTSRPDESLRRILQAAVNTVSSYGLDEAESTLKALQLAVVDVQFDATRMSGSRGAQVVTDHRMARVGILQEMSRLRVRFARGASAGATVSGTPPTVPAIADTPAAHRPVSYLSFAEWETRTRSTTMPVKADGTVNRERVELLLDDAAAWCASIIPGNLIRGGVLIPEGDLPAALVAVCKQVSTQIIDQWIRPRNEKYIEDCAACEDRAAIRLRDTAQTAGGEGGDAPEMPVQAVTRYLLASVDATFEPYEVILSDTSGDMALAIPSDAVPAGEQRYFAYGRPAAAGDYDHVYVYPSGQANTVNLIGTWQNGPDIDIAGVSVRLLRSRSAFADNANGRIIEAE